MSDIETRLGDSIARYRQQILEIAAKHGASNIRIFGSVARGTSTDESDLDLLVEFESDRTLLDQIALKQDLEDLLNRPIDIAEPNCLHPIVRDRVLGEAIPL
ncbi:nucleotidyltransferase [Leptolyngbya valderiana BDU 20041]|nr:nucleotidyltransferase family protein [Geitlerinema sp. CS-897]OAB59977.1 nucleotidyltransferase [Leptolyngbya valderiana BDU 20041]